MKDLCACGNEKDRRAKNCRSCSALKLRTNFRCSVEGCDKDAWSKGLCPMHLRRLKKHGSVYTVTKGPESDYWNFRGPYSGCWEWTGYVTNKGKAGREYGFVMINGGRQIVSRLVWEAVNDEPIPLGLEVCHKCDNPKCWRPDHLFLGTHRENMEDRALKGRNNSNFAVGFRLPQTRLSEDDVLEIRSLFSSGVKQIDLAKRFGVTPGHISDIANYKSRVVLDPNREYKTLSRNKAWDKSKGLCGICNETVDPEDTWHLDHIIPLSRGGADTDDNVQVTHPLCNWKKNNKMLPFDLFPINDLPEEGSLFEKVYR